MYWNLERETLDRQSLRRLQLERLRDLVERLQRDVPHYREVLRGASPSKLTSLGDVARLPFSTKTTLREHYPFGLVAVPLERVVRVHASSGTTGKPTVVAYTRSDMEPMGGGHGAYPHFRWRECSGSRP